MEELQENMKLLLDCLHYQQGSISSQKQALTTIATMCSKHGSDMFIKLAHDCDQIVLLPDTLCDYFRNIGGLKYAMKLMLETKSPELQITAMYTLGCGCEQNTVSQRILCNQTVFTFLHHLLTSDSNKGIKLTAAYFATCLMNGNVAAQNLAREMAVLESLILLYKQLHPSENKVSHNSDDINLTEDVKLWISISSALCTAVNNPQNELNQNMCSQILPAALNIFTSTVTFQIDLIRSAATVISACVANNNTVQERLRLVGGLQTCVQALKALIPYSKSAHKMEAVAHIVKIIFTATADVKSCETLSMLETVSVFLRLLQIISLDVSTKLNAVICLGMITEGCAKSRAIVTEVGLPILIGLMAVSKNEELSRTTTLVIKSCMEQAGLISGENKSEDTDDYGEPDGTLIEAAGTSPLRLTLRALDEKKLSLKDNVVQWLSTSGSIIHPADETEELQWKKSDPANTSHCPLVTSKGDRPSLQKPDCIATSSHFQLQKTSHCPYYAVIGSDCKGHIMDKCHHGDNIQGGSVVQNAEKIQHDKGLGKLLQHEEGTGKLRQHEEGPGKLKQHEEGPGNLLQHKEGAGKLQQHKERPGKLQQHEEEPGKLQQHEEEPGKLLQHEEGPGKLWQLEEGPGKLRQHEKGAGKLRQHEEGPGKLHQHEKGPGKLRQHEKGADKLCQHEEGPGKLHQPEERPGKLRQHEEGPGKLRQHGTAEFKTVIVTPMNGQLNVPQSTRPNIRYSTRYQPANHFLKQCAYTCGVNPHHIPRFSGIQCVKAHSSQQCLGCTPSKYPLLTSRNFRFHLKDDSHTCTYHKQLLCMLNETVNKLQPTNSACTLINNRIMNIKEEQPVDFCTTGDWHLVESEHNVSNHSDVARFHHSNPAVGIELTYPSCKALKHVPLLSDIAKISQNISLSSPNHLLSTTTEMSQHKLQVKFTEGEIQSLMDGVRNLGKRWRYILAAYPFNPCRTTVDLINQYRILHAKGLIS